MTAAPLGLACGCLWFGVFLFGQIAAFHWRPEIKRSLVLVRGIVGASAASIITVAVLTLPDLAAFFLAATYAAMTVGCLFVLYAPFFYSIHTSLSIESLLLLMKAGGRGSVVTLTRRFASHRLLHGRLHAMLESGYLIQHGEQFALTPCAQRVASAFAAVKSLWRLGAGG